MIAALADYAVDAATGFVPAHDPPARLPAAYDAWEAVAADLPALIRADRLRARLRALPMLDALALAGPRERERALLLLTVFVNGWVWGGREPDLRVPPPVAVPACRLAQAMDRPPIVHYGSMALNNWRRIDPAQPVATDNLHTQVGFLGGVDEDWFFVASLGVELAAAPLLGHVHRAARASVDDDDAALRPALEGISTELQVVVAALERMREWCDPHVFYHRVRPYLAGWPEPGVVFEGIDAQPRRHVGGSAGQSSVIQSVDAVLGVSHDGTDAGAYLRALRGYMPVPHRRFVDDLERASRVRERARRQPALRDAYDAAIEGVAQFRARHIAMAHDYVLRPSGMNPGERGTGGTDLARFLGSAARRTRATRLAGAPDTSTQ